MRFRTDPRVENEGVFFEFEHIRVKLARESENNRAFKEHMTAEYKKIATVIKANMLSDEKAKAMLKGAYAHAIVRSWETKDGEEWKPGVELLRNGKFELVPFSPEAVLEYLNDPANVDTWQALRESAREAAAFRELREDDVKN